MNTIKDKGNHCKLNIKLILSALVVIFGGNLLLLATLIEKHNSFMEHHHATTLIKPTIPEHNEETFKSSTAQIIDTKLSTKPLKDVTSLLWSEMTKPQQDEAYQKVLPYIEKHKLLVKKRANKGKGNRQKPSYEWSCQANKVGFGWGGHHVCTELLEKSNTCEFISFGIANDYTFEETLSRTYRCHGFAADPTVSYPTNLYNNVTFHQMGANILNANMEMRNNGAESWWVTSVPLLTKSLGLDRISILKMDCEGCEYAIARDIVRDDPSFFEHVDQFVVEVHLAREWLNTTETLYYYGILLKKLDDAGLRLHDARTLGCAPEHTKTGFMDVVWHQYDKNYCHNYLFAKA